MGQQFSQHKAVWSSICWDHKAIGLWLQVTALARVGQAFQGGALGLRTVRAFNGSTGRNVLVF